MYIIIQKCIAVFFLKTCYVPDDAMSFPLASPTTHIYLFAVLQNINSC